MMDCGRQGVRLYFYQKGLLFAKRGLEFCDTEERLLFELEKIWDYYQTCYPGYIPELIYVTGGKRNPLLEAAITERLEAECCDWTKLLDNSQESGTDQCRSCRNNILERIGNGGKKTDGEKEHQFCAL